MAFGSRPSTNIRLTQYRSFFAGVMEMSESPTSVIGGGAEMSSDSETGNEGVLHSRKFEGVMCRARRPTGDTSGTRAELIAVRVTQVAASQVSADSRWSSHRHLRSDRAAGCLGWPSGQPGQVGRSIVVGHTANADVVPELSSLISA